MKQIKTYIDHKALENIYEMDVRVHLDYGDVVYDRGEIDKVSKDGILLPVGISSTQLRNVESLQYEAARIVTGAWKSTSRDKLYGELDRLSIIYETQDTKFPNYLYQILEKQSNPRLTDLGLYSEMPGGIAKVKLSYFLRQYAIGMG